MASRIIENRVTAYLGHEDSPDISNPIHSSEVAKAYGFPGALVGGVTVWGWATDTILEALGEDWLKIGWSEFSFRQPTIPGDEMLIRATEDSASDSWSIEMINQDGVICVIGKVGLGKSEWSNEFVRSTSLNPTGDDQAKKSLTLETAEVGYDWAGMKVDFTETLANEFTTEKQRTNNPLFVGANPIAHPSWTAGWAEQLMRHNYNIPSSMHTRSRIQHLNLVPTGTQVFGGAHMVAAYERKAHHFVNFDVLLQDQNGADIAQLRHWTIFKIATPEERENAIS